MKWLATLFVAAVMTASAADITGAWKASIDTPNGAMEMTFTFKVDGSKLTGSINNQMMGETAISEGKIDGDNISFAVVNNFNGNEFRINYKGKVSEGEIKFAGEMAGMDRTFEFTAKKVKT